MPRLHVEQDQSVAMFNQEITQRDFDPAALRQHLKELRLPTAKPMLFVLLRIAAHGLREQRYRS